MNPTRAVSLGIGAIALLGVLIVGSTGLGSKPQSEAPAAVAVPAVQEPQNVAPSPGPQALTSNQYDAWVDNPSGDEEVADDDPAAPPEERSMVRRPLSAPSVSGGQPKPIEVLE